MVTGTTQHSAYVQWVQTISGHIRTYCSQVGPLPAFFLLRTEKYWPADTDPTMFVSTLMSYCVEFGRGDPQSKLALSRIIHFLLASLRQNLTQPHGIQEHHIHLRRAAKNLEFTSFVLREILPVVVEVGFKTRFWVFGLVYFPIVIEQAAKLLSNNEETAEITFGLLTRVLDAIIFHAHSSWAELGSKKLEGIMIVIMDFWRSVGSAMTIYAYNTDQPEAMDTYNTAFTSIAAKFDSASAELGSEIPEPNVSRPSISDLHNAYLSAFRAASSEWTMSEDDKWICIRDPGPLGEYKRVNLSTIDRGGLQGFVDYIKVLDHAGEPLVSLYEHVCL
jgi:hypothetical protein